MKPTRWSWPAIPLLALGLTLGLSHAAWAQAPAGRAPTPALPDQTISLADAHAIMDDAIA